MNPFCTFHPPWWSRDGHVQTIWAPFFARSGNADFRREIWQTPDADRLAVDWVDAPAGAPVVILFHGLGSSSRGHYARALAEALRQREWAGCFINFRGCGGMDNLLPRSYHAGDSAEIRWMLERAAALMPERPRYAVGVSLGGNALLKYLGEAGDTALEVLRRAAAVCAPIDLAATAAHLQKGPIHLYGRYFLKNMKTSVRRYRTRYPDLVHWPRVFSAKSLYDFDQYFTAPVHGFSAARQFWAEGSAAPLLSRIRVPTLLLHSADDPIVPIDVVRRVRISASVTRCITRQGGHVGFVDGPFPGHLRWLPNTLLDYFERKIVP
ncbi:alpha/beta fold hydrolase [Acidithiobacillus ferrianus]|uniref:Alpha/beta fold hydrolase n=2 Tax=Acidithiobacillus ferrianus TaxID=2678518 RepID=A0A845U4U5_9PROT|nr:alpha/beta fold hydrolase [Acidithiobacillus ferrianus]NDU42256.1 alpha/beta fold hydrolase [Acidithiobacillus ferrianus]